MAHKKQTAPELVATPRYPDLTHALELLEERLNENNSETHQQLLTKWQSTLHKVQNEIRRMEKLEEFSKNLTKKDTSVNE